MCNDIEVFDYSVACSMLMMARKNTYMIVLGNLDNY